MPFADLSQGRFHYSLTGRPGTPVLAFSHSLGASLSMWDPQAEAFSPRFHVLRYDIRGHGQSSAAPGPYSVEALAKDVLELIDFLQLDQIAFCGLSLGGQIGQWLGLHAPSRLRKLILCNTSAKIGNDQGWDQRIETVRAKGMKEVSAAVIGRWFTAAYAASHPSDVAHFQNMIESASIDGYASCCAAVRDFDSRAVISALRLPALVIAGTHDPATTPAEGRFLAAEIPRARYAELNAAHISNIEDCQHFNRELDAFLSA